MTERDKNQLAKQYMHLIQWASFRFSKKLSPLIFNNDDFYDSGVEILTICINKWNDREFDPIEFGKYFKTALFRRMRQMQMKANTKKRKQILISLDLIEDNRKKGGKLERKIMESYMKMPQSDSFSDVFYKELVDHVCNNLSNKLERELFMILVEPPNELLSRAISENRKKMKIALITDKRKCSLNVIKYEPYVFQYLKQRGYGITRCQYSSAMKSMKNNVKQILIPSREADKQTC